MFFFSLCILDVSPRLFSFHEALGQVKGFYQPFLKKGVNPSVRSILSYTSLTTSFCSFLKTLNEVKGFSRPVWKKGVNSSVRSTLCYTSLTTSFFHFTRP